LRAADQVQSPPDTSGRLSEQHVRCGEGFGDVLKIRYGDGLALIVTAKTILNVLGRNASDSGGKGK